MPKKKLRRYENKLKPPRIFGMCTGCGREPIAPGNRFLGLNCFRRGDPPNEAVVGRSELRQIIQGLQRAGVRW